MDKITILFLAADPSDSARLRLGQELRDIREKLQLSKQRDNFLLESRESVRTGDITQAIFDIEPQVVHFSGHGMQSGDLCFEDRKGCTKPVSPNALANLFELVAKQVDCVILNACYSVIQAEAISKHIPFVIGMNQEIGDEAAIIFATGFYKALGAGRSFKDAYKFARVEIQIEGIPEDSTPVLYTKEGISIDSSLEELRNKQHKLLKNSDAKQAICKSLIDLAVQKCRLQDWQVWTSWALSPDPRWPSELPKDIFEFREKMLAVIWVEEFEELKRATLSFAILLNQAAQTFLENSEVHDDLLFSYKFYKNKGLYNPNYHKDLDSYENWLDHCYTLIKEATKAANWFADVVRRDIDPMFFAVEGKFLITEGPFMDLSFRTHLLEFTQEEKSKLPDLLLDQLANDFLAK